MAELRAELEPHLDDEESDLFPMLMSRAPDRARIAGRLVEARAEHGASVDRSRASERCPTISVRRIGRAAVIA